jgi:enoyl-CoA hydratase/carnithine racemase
VNFSASRWTRCHGRTEAESSSAVAPNETPVTYLRRLIARALEFSRLFASYPPAALASTKQLMNRIRSLQHADAVQEARQLNASMRLTSESRAGIGDFLKK